MAVKEEYVATGRRKTAVASVRLRPGKGDIDVNKRKVEEYFPSELMRDEIMTSLKKFSSPKNYDIIIRVKGGGLQGQAGAVCLGIARALVKESEERRQELKSGGFLTRDPRKKERKKYGLKGARCAFQFSKR